MSCCQRSRNVAFPPLSGVRRIFLTGCLASAARQAEGNRRGEVGKSRTPQGPSTGCVLWAGDLSTSDASPQTRRWATQTRRAAWIEATDGGGVDAQPLRKACSNSWTLNCLGWPVPATAFWGRGGCPWFVRDGVQRRSSRCAWIACAARSA